MPWSGDGYGPLDFTLLDRHHGMIEDWRALVTEIHRRGMYVVLDNTMATSVSQRHDEHFFLCSYFI